MKYLRNILKNINPVNKHPLIIMLKEHGLSYHSMLLSFSSHADRYDFEERQTGKIQKAEEHRHFIKSN